MPRAALRDSRNQVSKVKEQRSLEPSAILAVRQITSCID